MVELLRERSPVSLSPLCIRSRSYYETNQPWLDNARLSGTALRDVMHTSNSPVRGTGELLVCSDQFRMPFDWWARPRDVSHPFDVLPQLKFCSFPLICPFKPVSADGSHPDRSSARYVNVKSVLPTINVIIIRTSQLRFPGKPLNTLPLTVPSRAVMSIKLRLLLVSINCIHSSAFFPTMTQAFQPQNWLFPAR